MKTGRDRYLNDPHFALLVDLMVGHIYQHDFTPSEMRDAAMVASIKFEAEQMRPITISAEADRLLKRFPELKRGGSCGRITKLFNEGDRENFSEKG